MGFFSNRPSRVAVPDAISTTSAAAITVRLRPSVTVTGSAGAAASAARICSPRAALAAGITKRSAGRSRCSRCMASRNSGISCATSPPRLPGSTASKGPSAASPSSARAAAASTLSSIMSARGWPTNATGTPCSW